MSRQRVTITDPDGWAVADERHVLTIELTPNHASVVRLTDEALQQLVDAAAARGIVAQ